MSHPKRYTTNGTYQPYGRINRTGDQGNIGDPVACYCLQNLAVVKAIGGRYTVAHSATGSILHELVTGTYKTILAYAIALDDLAGFTSLVQKEEIKTLLLKYKEITENRVVSK